MIASAASVIAVQLALGCGRVLNWAGDPICTRHRGGLWPDGARGCYHAVRIADAAVDAAAPSGEAAEPAPQT
jgi:hypothetical protein